MTNLVSLESLQDPLAVRDGPPSLLQLLHNRKFHESSPLALSARLLASTWARVGHRL